MKDLIDRSLFLKILNDYVAKAYGCDGVDDENVIEYQKANDDNSAYIIQGFNEVYELLEDIPTVCNNGWIACRERLPEKHKDVLVTDGNDMMVWSLVEDYSGYSWEDEYGVWNDFERVIYWQPLPQPHKESDTNGN